MALNPTHLLWLDMEMTGLSPDTDRIIELAIVVTDADLNTVAEGPVIGVADLPAQFRPASGPASGATGCPSLPERAPGDSAALLAGRTWEELERAYALELLEDAHWNVSRAAKRAGLNRSTFDSRLKKLGIAKS